MKSMPNGPKESSTHEWRPIPGYEGIYQVRAGRDGGCVRRIAPIKRSYVGRELKTLSIEGIPRATLCRPGDKPRTMQMHVIILEAFVGPRPPGARPYRRDGDKLNNTLGNIFWGRGRQRSSRGHPAAELLVIESRFQ